MSFKVVILKTKPQSLKQAEQFLRNRQWQIIATTNLRDAIAAVIQKQPEFILIAADHPNRKVRALPKLIGQAFPVKVVGFVEASTNASMAILHEMALEYNVFPPVSGPAIERTILKMKKDEEKKEQDRQRAIENGTYMPEGGSDTTTLAGEGFSSAREMLARLASGDEHTEDAGFVAGSSPTSDIAGHTSGNPNADGTGFASGQGTNGQGPGLTGGGAHDGAGFPGYMPQHGSSDPSAAGYMPGGQGGFHPNGNSSGAPHAGPGSPGYMPPQNGESTSHPFYPSHSNPSNGTQDPAGNAGHSPHRPGYGGGPGDEGLGPGFDGGNGGVGSGARGTQGATSNQAQDGDPDFNNPYASSWETLGDDKPAKGADSQDGESDRGTMTARRKDAPIMEHGPYQPRKKPKEPKYIQDPANYPDRDSVIVKGTQAALEESVLVTEGDAEYTEVKAATNVACITISSPRFSGYLVAALGADRQIDDEFLKSVQDRLFSFLRANGETISEDEGMNLKLEQVEFEEWAISQADFLRKSVHGSNEIAMAFFPSKETETKLEQSVNENMLKLGIDELRDDVPVEFDLYIYLPSNKKYLLYTPQGRKLFGAQRGRLRTKGVTHMHLRKDSAGQVKRYRAQVYLNEMIGNFKRDKKAA